MILIADRGVKQEVGVDSVGIIRGCRINTDGKIEFRVEINKQRIWIPASSVFTLPEEKDFKNV